MLLLCDPAGIVKAITPNAGRVLGEACDRAAEFGCSLDELLQPHEPVEVALLLEQFHRSHCSAAFSRELLTRASSGGPRWLELQCCNLLNQPQFAGYLLEIRDITTTRVDVRQRDLHAALLRGLPDSVMVTDSNGVIQYVNPAFELLTGYHALDLVGEPASILKSGKQKPEFYQKLWRTIDDGKTFRGQLVNRKRTGELYHEEIVITPVRDAGGEITAFISVGRDITEFKKFEAQAEERALFDPLTGVSNLRLLRERSRQILALARRHGHTAAMLHLDLDGLRPINDRMGRSVGDEVLRRVAERLKQGLRESDTLARLGSDEFLILLSEVAEEDATARVVRRLRDSLCKPFKIQEYSITIGTSIGVALYPQDATTFDELADNASLALQRARNTHSGVEFFKCEVTDLTNERLSLEDDLSWAWERKQFVLHYQPIVELGTGDVIGAEALTRGHMIGIEALARWPHLERGMIEPAQFIPMAERTGRIIALDRWAIATACKQAAIWSQNGWKGWVSVNLSARSLHDCDLVSYLSSCMEQHSVQPGRIVLEVTESSAMRDVEMTARVLHELRECGVLIALDDFGTGHSSLAYLKHFPVDILKLDRSFTQDIGTDTKYEQLIEVIITLAHRMGARIIAEGVEDEEQLAWLRNTGCDYVQGYHIGRPAPPEFIKPTERVVGRE